MPDWGWWLLALTTTGIFFIPSLLLWLSSAKKQKAFRRFVQRELLVTTPPLVAGPIQAQGTCNAVGPIQAPLSACPCVGFTLEASVFVNDSDGGNYWDLGEVNQITSFVLRLGDRALPVSVEPSYLWLSLPATTQREACLQDLPAPLYQRILAQARERWEQDRPDVIPRWKQPVRLVERALCDGTTILIMGEASTSISDGGMHIEPRRGLPLLVMDGSKSAVLDRLSKDLRKPRQIEMLDELLLLSQRYRVPSPRTARHAADRGDS